MTEPRDHLTELLCTCRVLGHGNGEILRRCREGEQLLNAWNATLLGFGGTRHPLDNSPEWEAYREHFNLAENPPVRRCVNGAWEDLP